MADPSNTTVQVSTDPAFGTLVLNEETEYKTSRAFTKGELPYGVNLYARINHKHPETGTSNWSTTVQFKIVIPYSAIGVCLDNSNSSVKGTFYWIDELGNRLTSFDWTSHPCWNKITMSTEDASRAPVTMTVFPTTYVKTATSGPSGTFANGKKCWWIADQPAPGFRPCLTFKRSTSRGADGKYLISENVKLGTFLCHQESAGGRTVLGSKRGQTVLASTTKANFKSYIQARNNVSAGQSGWRMFDIYDMGLLRLLCLIAKANSDSQTQWGDNSAGTSYPKTGSTNARMVFKGTHSSPTVSIEDLWRCYWYHADLITITSGRVDLTSPMNLTSALSFSGSTSQRTQPTSSGWIRDVLQCQFTVGDDVHDLMELFLPGQVVSAENQGTFSDYHEFDDRPAGLAYSIFCGGSVVEASGYGRTSDAGLYFQLFRKEPFDCAGGGAANNPESHSSRLAN